MVLKFIALLILGTSILSGGSDTPKPKTHQHKSFTNKLGITFVYIPSQTFDARGPMPYIPWHKIRLSGYWMSAAPITQAQFRLLFPWWKEPYPGHGLYPAMNLSFSQAKNYATELTVRLHHGQYRLPTDAEWECAARGGLIHKRFPWGNTVDAKTIDEYGALMRPKPTNVEHFKPNGFGLYDMVGDATAYVQDSDYSDSRKCLQILLHNTLKNPLFVGLGKARGHLYRGCGYANCLSISWWHAVSSDHENMDPYTGFRLVFTSSPTKFDTIKFSDWNSAHY